MTELQLYKFITDNNIEYHFEHEGVYIFIPFDLLKQFTELSKNYFSDDPIEVVLRDDYICFVINDCYEYFGIDINNIFGVK